MDDVKKGFIKAEQKSYQLQKLAEQKKMSTVSLSHVGTKYTATQVPEYLAHTDSLQFSCSLMSSSLSHLCSLPSLFVCDITKSKMHYVF